MQVATSKMKSMIFFYIIVNIINLSYDENIKKPFLLKNYVIIFSILLWYHEMSWQ